ncbi:MAG: hypothetical protein WBA07_19990 [Rivularia sp. (in: cyanobacteria)]
MDNTVSSSEPNTDTLIDLKFLKFDNGLVVVDDSLFASRTSDKTIAAIAILVLT